MVRELTKLHEEVLRMTLGEAAVYYTDDREPRGEYVLVMDGRCDEISQDHLPFEDALALAKRLRDGGMSASAAAKEAARQSGIPKGDIYRRLNADGGEN